MIFSVENGFFGYRREELIHKDISFNIKEGEIVSVLGPNGVGKTTLLKCMMGLLEWSKGASLIDGVDIREIKPKELWKKIAYVPQAKSVNFSYTIEELVLLGRSAHISMSKQPTRADLEKAHEAIKEIGIWHLKDKFCNRVSGGELQMALIARALCAEPKMLVLDEPESNLDFKNQLIILDTMSKLARENKISCVFNTHYPAHSLKISDKSLVISKNGAVWGDTKAIITDDLMKEVFDVKVHINKVDLEDESYYTVTALKIL